MLDGNIDIFINGYLKWLATRSESVSYTHLVGAILHTLVHLSIDKVLHGVIDGAPGHQGDQAGAEKHRHRRLEDPGHHLREDVYKRQKQYWVTVSFHLSYSLCYTRDLHGRTKS